MALLSGHKRLNPLPNPGLEAVEVRRLETFNPVGNLPVGIAQQVHNGAAGSFIRLINAGDGAVLADGRGRQHHAAAVENISRHDILLLRPYTRILCVGEPAVAVEGDRVYPVCAEQGEEREEEERKELEFEPLPLHAAPPP